MNIENDDSLREISFPDLFAVGDFLSIIKSDRLATVLVPLLISVNGKLTVSNNRVVILFSFLHISKTNQTHHQKSFI